MRLMDDPAVAGAVIEGGIAPGCGRHGACPDGYSPGERTCRAFQLCTTHGNGSSNNAVAFLGIGRSATAASAATLELLRRPSSLAWSPREVGREERNVMSFINVVPGRRGRPVATVSAQPRPSMRAAARSKMTGLPNSGHMAKELATPAEFACVRGRC